MGVGIQERLTLGKVKVSEDAIHIVLSSELQHLHPHLLCADHIPLPSFEEAPEHAQVCLQS